VQLKKVLEYIERPLLVDPAVVYADIIQGRTVKEQYRLAIDMLRGKFLEYLDLQVAQDYLQAGKLEQQALDDDVRTDEAGHIRCKSELRRLQYQLKANTVKLDACETYLDILTKLLDGFDDSARQSIELDEVLESQIFKIQGQMKASQVGVRAEDINNVTLLTNSIGKTLELLDSQMVLDAVVDPMYTRKAIEEQEALNDTTRPE
jgi:hypothetical protein